MMKDGQDGHKPIANNITKYFSYLAGLNDGQKQCAELILTSKDRVIGIQGYAGVGKTYMLKSVNQIAKKQGYKLIGMSPTGVATRNLNKEAVIESSTLQRFLIKYDGVANGRGTLDYKKREQAEFKNKAIIVDEASMISTTQMQSLLTISKELNFKVILVGDTKQLDSVEAGIPFHELQRNGMNTAEMRNIMRQNNLDLKEAVYNTIDRKIGEAFSKISCDIKEVNKNAKTATINEFMAMSEEQRKSTMILAPANEDREKINDEISKLIYLERTRQNSSHNPQIIYENINLTEAEKTRAYKFSTAKEVIDEKAPKIGNIILFSKDRDYLDIKKNDYCEVIKIEQESNLITIKNQRTNKISTFDPIKVKGSSEKIYFEVFVAKERIFKEGDKIAFTRSIPEIKVINSDGAKITKITKSKIFLELDNGKKTTVDQSSNAIKHLDHSYAVTTHKAQGLTCNTVIALAESWRKNLTTQKNFYVEISRAKEKAIIITDNKAKTIKRLEENTGITISAREHQNLPCYVEDIVSQENDLEKIKDILAPFKTTSKEAKQDPIIASSSNKLASIQHKFPLDKEKDNRKLSSNIKTVKKDQKFYIPNLNEAEIKEKFLLAAREAGFETKDIDQVVDKAFAKLNSKFRFGQKQEFEMCWHGEAGYIKDYKSSNYLSWGIKSIKLDKNTKFKEISLEDIEKLKKESEIKQKKQELEKEQKFQETAKKAEKYFNLYNKTGSSDYLKRKSIDNLKIENIRFSKNRLIIPVKDAEGKIWSLQYINEDGQKLFLKDSKKQGNFFLLGDKNLAKEKEVYLAEGFATAATIHLATGKPVAVCFDAGNIEHTLKNLKAAHPQKQFIIAADNDQWKEHNTGREKAELAASKYGAKVILPQFKYEHKDHQPTDFNDLQKLAGINEVRNQLQAQNLTIEHHQTCLPHKELTM